MPDTDMTPARQLAAAIEPVAGQAQFAPECHAKYKALGFGPSSGMAGATALPDRSAYFCARGAALGQVPGEVIAAAFAVFRPDLLVDLVAEGWQRTDAATIWAAREAGAVAQLKRILGEDPPGATQLADLLLAAAEPLPLAGRALFAGQRSLPIPADPVARLWRATDVLREYRGDSHVIAWTSEGLDPIEVGLLGDLYWGLAPRSHTAGRGWTPDQLAAAEERLGQRGLLDGDELTATGFELRDRIETRTDTLVEPAIEIIGARLAGLVETLRPWGDAIRSAGGYLTPAVRFTEPRLGR
jgi:hypothetical protein